MSMHLDQELSSKIDLLEESSEHLLQMTRIAREGHEDEEVRIFYSHIAQYCLRFRGYVELSRQNYFQPNRGIIDSAVQHLGSLVSASSLQKSRIYITTTEDSLRALNSRWNTMREQHNDMKATFVRTWLEMKMSEKRRNALERALEGCAAGLENETYKYSYNQSKDIGTTPDACAYSGTVWKAAQSAFDAFLDPKSCSCMYAHEIQAKLELGSFETSKEVAKNQRNVGSASSHKRKVHEDNDGVEQLRFDVLLSTGLGVDWQEIRVWTVKETKVTFALEGEELSSSKSKSTDESMKEENLCETVKLVHDKGLRLELRLISGKLFAPKRKRSVSDIDKGGKPFSLSQCFEEKPEYFTGKTTSILSLIFGYMVVRLNNTSWLKPGWTSASIQFFKNTSDKTPLRPFIQPRSSSVYRSGEGLDTQFLMDEKSVENDASSDLNRDHRCLELIDLAVVLIELHFVKSFRRLAEISKVKLIEQPYGRICLIDVDMVFKGDEESTRVGWRSHMPNDAHTLTAIDNCLEPTLWRDDDGAPLDSGTLTSRIQEHVVRHLEMHLTRSYTDIPLDEIDKYARNMDLGRWGQSTIPESDQDANFVGPTVLASPPSFLPIFRPFAADQGEYHATKVSQSDNMALCHHSNHASPCPTINTDDPSSRRTQRDACQFFDDMTSGKDCEKYRIWKSGYDSVYGMFITEDTNIPDPVKIAILDTGIDLNHEHIFGRDMNVQGKHNYYSETQKNVTDNHGHGTFAASLILDYARDAELYVIKIADKNATPAAKIVAKAINHALDKWGVDIISMSFGWPSRDFDGFDDLEDAIDRAYGMKVLMFAAAANNGGRSGRAYPACSPHVICVHSTDTDGNRSPFSPTAEPNAINIATVGESVTSAWPTSLCHDGERVQTRSGTSYATPIVVGISAFLLHYVRLYLSESEAKILKRKEKMEALLRRCAERGPYYQPRDRYLSVDLSLHSQNLFGQKDKEDVRRDIVKILRL